MPQKDPEAYKAYQATYRANNRQALRLVNRLYYQRRKELRGGYALRQLRKIWY